MILPSRHMVARGLPLLTGELPTAVPRAFTAYAALRASHASGARRSRATSVDPAAVETFQTVRKDSEAESPSHLSSAGAALGFNQTRETGDSREEFSWFDWLRQVRLI